MQASLTQVRVLNASEVVAEHRRVYGKGEQVEDPTHLEALLSTKRAARHHRGQDRLAQAAPSSRELLQQAAHRGTPISRATAELVQLLDDYGAGELEHAITEALNNDVPHPSGVRQVLERRREQRAGALKLYGLLAHWDEMPEAELPWVRRLIAWEEVERRRRGLEPRRDAGA